MSTLAQEIQDALVEMQEKLRENKALDDKSMQVLFLTSLIEEAQRGE